jgi:KDO2-lipid IV(A) lauroyltransferase
MARVLGRSDRLDRATSDVFASYGRYWAETLWVSPRRVGAIDAQVEIDGLEHMSNNRGTGLILVLPHVGNWEAAAVAGPRSGVEIAAVAEQLPNPRLTRWFVEMRAAFGLTIIPHGRGTSRAIEDAIKRHAAVALLADRDLTGRGIEVEFFGERTTLPGGPANLAQKTGVPVVIAGTYFTPNGYRVVLNEVSMDGAKDVVERTQRIARAMERVIREAPEQWHLLQPNWPSDRELEAKS